MKFSDIRYVYGLLRNLKNEQMIGDRVDPGVDFVILMWPC